MQVGASPFQGSPQTFSQSALILSTNKKDGDCYVGGDRMKTVIFITVLCVLPLVSAAQTWTNEQLGVLDAMEACENTWVEVAETGSWSHYADKCVASDNAAFMWADGGFYGVREWKRGIETKWLMPNDTWQWSATRPWRVIIEDDVALVFFTPITVHTDPDGKVRELPSQRRLHWRSSPVIARQYRGSEEVGDSREHEGGAKTASW